MSKAKKLAKDTVEVAYYFFWCSMVLFFFMFMNYVIEGIADVISRGLM